MIARLTKFAIIACLLFAGINAQASPISVDILAHTDPFHFGFVTSVKPNAVSDDINYYNNFVHTVANNAGIGNHIGQPGLTWDAIISKPIVDAINYVNITYPLYTLDDSLVASGAVTWDRQINTSISLTEAGTNFSDYMSKGTVREMIPGADFAGREIWVRSGMNHLSVEPQGGQPGEPLQLLPPMTPLRGIRTIDNRHPFYTAAPKPASNGVRIGWMGGSQAAVSAIEVQQPVAPQKIFHSWKH